MATKLFVGSLSYGVNDDQLKDAFAAAGTVVSAKVIIDRETGRSKGFGFVEMSTDEEAQAAVKMLDGKEIDGRTVAVNEARPQENRERRPFGGGGNGGGDRGGRDHRGGGGNRY
jgi:RNA recognition motif-containing protein